MAYRITLECGDKSFLKPKKTQDGFTHDWEVFVRGTDNSDIHHYIEKVVFNLHETFPKPKRVIKEPPYILKESGYAGFDIPIHIYLKNKNEPKRFEILYKLYLDNKVPTISHIQQHSEVFVNPTDEFRKKLLKGGAVPISSTESASEKNEVKILPMVGKPKLSGNEGKKHRISEPKTSNPFNDLFGPPIKTAKVTLENKKVSDKTSNVKSFTAPEKSDKFDKSTKIKHSPHKEAKRDKSSEERKEKRDKDKDATKDKEKTKEKSKRSSSPSNKVTHQSSETKRPSSPSPMKKPTTPPPIPKRPSSPSSKSKEKESKKSIEPEKEKEKVKESTKNTNEESRSEKSEKESKSERKKDKKKHKEDREKEKKEKHRDKEREKSRDKESIKSGEKKVEKSEKVDKDKLQEPKHSKEDRKSPKPIKENEKIKEEKISKSEKSEKSEKSDKKELKSEKSDKSKHKHKKRDKKDKRDGSKEREKKEKREKSKSSSEKQNDVTNQTSSTVLPPSRIPEVQDRDSSESAMSGDEDSITETRTPAPLKKEPVPTAPPVEPLRTMSPPPPPVNDIKKEKSERKRDRSKSSKEDRESKKKKRKTESRGLGDDEEGVKKSKDRDHSTSPLIEPVSSSQSPIATNVDSVHSSKSKHSDDQLASEQTTGDSEQVAPDSTNSTLVDTEEPLVFSEDYVSQLKDLQQKIMTLQDNQELQRVVQVIAETGQYEITKKTFDFDLCALDRRTVQRLQQFFAS